MRNLLPPDIFGILVPILMVGISVLLATVFIPDSQAELRIGAIAFASVVIGPAFAIIWGQTRLRFYAFRFYYRHWGPTCSIRILGDIPVEPSSSDKELLGGFFHIVQRAIPESRARAVLNNRMVISDGLKILTLDAVRVDPTDNDEVAYLDLDMEDFDEFVDYGGGFSTEECRIAFDLSGYQGKLTRMDALLEEEVSPLLEGINTDIKRRGAQPTLSVRALIDGRNPFFVFYLKDMPNTDTDRFKLSIVSGDGEDYVAVDATPGYVNVAARSPARLLTAARRMLASPMLYRQ